MCPFPSLQYAPPSPGRQMIRIDPARRLVVVINSAWPEAESNERRAALSNFLNTIAKEIDEEKTESPDP
jgi:hypothetical protein